MFPEELTLVRKALWALSVDGNERDILINIMSAVDRCHRYSNDTHTIGLIETACFEDHE